MCAVVLFDGCSRHTDGGSPSDYLGFSRDLNYAAIPSSAAQGPIFFPAGGPFGTGAWEIGDRQDDYMHFGFPAISTTFLVAGWFRHVGTLASWHFWRLYESGTTANHCSVEIKADGTIAVKRGTTTLGTSTNMVVQDQWYHIALKYNIHDSTGSFELRVNNVNWVSGTGLDTREGGTNPEVSMLRMAGSTLAAGGQMTLPMIWSTAGDAPTDFAGMHKAWTVRPNGDSATANWAPLGAGANYVEVDDVEADDDTTYNSSNTVTDKDRLTLEDLPESPDTIFAVQTKLLTKQTEPGALKVKSGVFAGTTEDQNAGFTPGLEYEYHTHLMTVNPDDAAPWEEADVNALQVQYEHVA